MFQTRDLRRLQSNWQCVQPVAGTSSDELIARNECRELLRLDRERFFLQLLYPSLAASSCRLCHPLGDRFHARLPRKAAEAMAEKLSDYLKTAEAAEFLGVSQNTLRAWAKQGKIPVQVNPLNNYRLFRREDLQAFLDSVAGSVLGNSR